MTLLVSALLACACESSLTSLCGRGRRVGRRDFAGASLIEVFHPKAGDWDFVEYTYDKNAQLDLQGAIQKIPEGYHTSE
jgi:hypothetical protein